MKTFLDRFFAWYEKHLLLNISIAFGLFLLQLVHLYWLFTDVVLFKIIGQGFFPVSQFWQTVIVLVDYTEIPALASAGLIYLNEIRKKDNFKSLLFLGLLLSQFIHIFWITDEFVINQFTGQGTPIYIPGWLAWVAISIDYLELPVIYDTFFKLKKAFKDKDLTKVSVALKKN